MIHYSSVDTKIGLIFVVEKDGKIVFIAIGSQPEKKTIERIRKHFGKEEALEQANSVLSDVCNQIAKFAAGEIREMDFPLEMHGTDFQKEVWKQIAVIPYGKVKTYGELAKLINKPAASRAVGAACGANPLPLIIPCHRVLGSDGSLTGFGGGMDMKEKLLKIEKAI